MATDDKYDRQLRLWGAEGQRKLATSHVLLINAFPTGTEALKNLILPGVGKFTIADKGLVTPRDCGNNFFVTEGSIGKPRAEITTALLGELNPDSQGKALPDADASTFIKDPSKIAPYDLIIGSDLAESEILALADICSKFGKSFIVASAFGLLGYARIYKPIHTVIESKPTGVVEADLRLYKPFPELLAFASCFDLAHMDSKKHSHVPFPVILLQAQEMWKKLHDGKLPANFKEKEEFTNMIKKQSLDFGKEDNFQEAVRNVPICFTSSSIKEEIKQIIDDPHCDEKENKDKFWILAAGLKRFYLKYKETPLNGKIPDITADTESYLAMQKIYETKAHEHWALFEKEIVDILKERALPPAHITKEDIAHFCSNNATIMCIKFNDISNEYLKKPNPDTLESEIPDGESLILWYFLVRASMRYHQKYAFWPAEKAPHDKYLAEFDAYKAIVLSVIKEALGSETKFVIDDKYIKEMLRYSNAKIHTICSILGGVVGQEAIKLITHIFSPMNNTMIYEGAASKIGVFNL